MTAQLKVKIGQIEYEVDGILERRHLMKEMVMSLEEDFGARKTMRKLDSIIQNFAVYGGNRPHVNYSTPEGGIIWGLLQSAARATSHAEALAVIRDVQKEYCDFVKAAEAN